MKLLIFILVMAVCCIYLYFQRFVYMLVYDYETGRLYKDGQFVKTCETGRYRLRKTRDQILKVDRRLQSVTIPAQSIFTLDSIQIKVTLIANYKISDSEAYFSHYQSSEAQFYLEMQLVLRERVSQSNLDDLLLQQDDLNLALKECAQPRLAELGMELVKVEVKDLMLPADLRAAYAQKLVVQKQAEVKLEQARSEQATLRKLANAARLLDQNPSLLALRLMHSIEQSQVSHSIHFTGATATVTETNTRETPDT